MARSIEQAMIRCLRLSLMPRLPVFTHCRSWSLSTWERTFSELEVEV